MAESKPKVSLLFFQLVYSKQFPKASRILVLVRHGQYNLDGTQDSERYLLGLWFILDQLYIMIYNHILPFVLNQLRGCFSGTSLNWVKNRLQ